jgi:hypothetical protein
MGANIPRRKRQVRGQEEWREIIGRFVDSGLSGRAFCHREQLSMSAFHRWRTALMPRSTNTVNNSGVPLIDLGELKPAVVTCPEKINTRPSQKLASPEMERSGWRLQLDLGCGMHLTIERS